MILEHVTERIEQWMAESRHWIALMGVFGGTIDALAAAAYQTRLAAYPGQVLLPGVPGLGGFDNVDALPYIGRDRRIFQGLAETPWAYAAELRQWRESAQVAATPMGLLHQLAAVLGPNIPLMRLVNTHGDWWTREVDGALLFQNVAGAGLTYGTDGSITFDATPAQAWDWDSSTVPAPHDQNDAARWWLIIYPPCSGIYLTDDDGFFSSPGVYGDGWNDPVSDNYDNSPDAGTVGTNASIQLVELVRGVVKQWRSAGLLCAYVIVAFDPDSFAPDGSSSAYPDGEWGQLTKYSSFFNSQIPSRLATARYWPGAPGGVAAPSP